MKSLIDFLLTMIEDYKEKEYIASRDVVNHPTEAEHHKAKQEAYKEVLDYLQFSLKQKQSVTKMEAIQKEITELYATLTPMAKTYVASTLKRDLKNEDLIIRVILKRYDAENNYQVREKRRGEEHLSSLNVDFTFQSIAEMAVNEAAWTQTGTCTVKLETETGFYSFELSEMFHMTIDNEDLPF